jgi:hypothetical protein
MERTTCVLDNTTCCAMDSIYDSDRPGTDTQAVLHNDDMNACLQSTELKGSANQDKQYKDQGLLL